MQPRARVAWMRYAAAIVLVAGLSSSWLLYPAADNALNDEGGSDSAAAYRFDPADSKQALQSMELYGGQANVLAYELRTWVAGLWQGKSAALMVAGLSILVALGLLYSATHPPPAPPPGADGRD